MNQRVGGLFIVIMAILFLWLYDTGRWSAIVGAVSGKQPGTGAAGAGAANSLFGGVGSLFGSNTGSTSQAAPSYETELFCNQWPGACPYNATGPIQQGSSQGGGSNPLSSILGLAGTIGQLFGLP